MTYPLIGNYGINQQDVESKHPQVAGFIVKELSPIYSNYRADRSLEDYLKESNIVGIEGIDTRALTRKLRINGSMRGVLSTDRFSMMRRAASIALCGVRADGRCGLGQGSHGQRQLRLGGKPRRLERGTGFTRGDGLARRRPGLWGEE